jgi:lipoprotein NlpI
MMKIVSSNKKDELSSNQKSALAYYNRGVIWSLKGENDLAIRDFNEALSLNPQFAKAFAMRGRKWFEKSDLEQALNDFRSSLRLNPDNQEVASAIQFLKKLMEIK